MSLTSDLKELVFALGFELVGISPAEELPAVSAAILARVTQGQMGGLAWFDAERAAKCAAPHHLLPAAAVLVSLAASYNCDQRGGAPDADATGSRPRGRMSRYAWGQDYHNVLRQPLERIRQFLARRGRCQGRAELISRAFVDTAPIAERAFAALSGIGWIGKSTNLLTSRYGSWVFLSEIVTTLELEIDSPLRKSCGNCQRCLEVCPTGAIVAPYVLDAGRCISYLTIEHRGPIPPGLRARLGDWVFGCDACQDSCPVNRKATVSQQGLFPRVEWPDQRPDLLELLNITEVDYQARSRGSALRRAKRSGLQRNATVALGNSGDRAAIPYLIEAITNTDTLVRGHAIWALGQLGGRAAKAALESHRSREFDGYVQGELENALASC